MGAKLLGVPLVLWGTAAIALTVIWTIFWPSDKAIPGDSLRFVILRWFHARVRMLLALAAFLAAFSVLGGAATARLVALSSLGVYLVFIATVSVAW